MKNTKRLDKKSDQTVEQYIEDYLSLLHGKKVKRAHRKKDA